MDNNLDKVKVSIQNLEEKKCRIYFLTQDVKNNPKGSVKYIYQMAMTLKKNGYNPIILHEKNDYTGVSEWMGEEYMTELPHKSIENQNLEISPEDFIIIPEIYAFVMDQLKNLPCGKIVLAQTAAYMLETLQPGQTWQQFGFFKCITTSERQKEYMSSIMKNISYDIVEPFVPTVFRKDEKPPKTVIAINTRNHSDTANLIKAFYLKYPQFRFFTFKDMRNMTELEFANSFHDCCLSVWIDDDSGFGTFPIESMASGVPVLCKIPDIIPDWMVEDNGIYSRDKITMIDQIAIFIQSWMEDSIKDELYVNIENTAKKYQDQSAYENKVLTLFDGYVKNRLESFSEQLKKLE